MEEIERLRAEIERRRDNLGPVEFDMRKRAKFDVYEGLLSYIDYHFPKMEGCDDLDKAAENCAYYKREDDEEGGYDLAKLEGFYLGAQWQKEHIMKGAVELKINRDTLYDLKPLIHDKIGDKVKLIIFPSNNK